MNPFALQSRQDSMQAAMAATGVGTWELDLAANLCFFDTTFAMIYGFTPVEGESGVPVHRLDSALHVDDRARGIAKRALKTQTGGLFVNEYRVVQPGGAVRWVLARGRYERDASGVVSVARGIVIDVTESKSVGYSDGQGFFLDDTPQQDNTSVIVRVADHAMATRRAIDELEESSSRALRPLIDTLLLQIGHRLTRDTH